MKIKIRVSIYFQKKCIIINARMHVYCQRMCILAEIGLHFVIEVKLRSQSLLSLIIHTICQKCSLLLLPYWDINILFGISDIKHLALFLMIPTQCSIPELSLLQGEIFDSLNNLWKTFKAEESHYSLDETDY